MVNNLVCDIINYINENINDKISIEELTQEFNYNRYYIMKLFKRELDISIINYINCIRIYNSLNSLRSNNSILNVALNNGFYSQEYYTEIFKKVVGTNPTTYKKFITQKYLSTKKEEEIVLSNLIKLENTITKVNTYKTKRRQDNNIKTIFR